MNISLLMLTYNRRSLVERCFRSLAHTLERNDVLEWLILDNASTDDTPGYLRHFVRDQPKVSCHFSTWNRGVAGGRDYLMRHARGDVVVLLDSDTVITDERFLDNLLRALHRPGVAIVGAAAHFVPPGWRWPFTVAADDYEGPCDLVPGYCQAFWRTFLNNGRCRLDLAFNPYWLEDTDFCFQAALQGRIVWSLPRNGSGIWHEWGKSGAASSDFAEKYRYFVDKWRGRGVVACERNRPAPVAEKAVSTAAPPPPAACPRPTPSPRLYLICTLERTGSEYLCWLLRSTGMMGDPQEWYNQNEPRYQARNKFGIPFLETLARETGTVNGLFGIKIMLGCLDNFGLLERWDAIRHRYAPQMIWLRRRDKLRQAISLYRARQTGEWRRITGEPFRKTPLRFDARQIWSHHDQLLRWEEDWRREFRAIGERPLEVWYEDIQADPRPAVREICRLAGVTANPGNLRKCPLVIQRDEITEMWVRRLRA
jgi:LPS sulfotransferase NodH